MATRRLLALLLCLVVIVPACGPAQPSAATAGNTVAPATPAASEPAKLVSSDSLTISIPQWKGEGQSWFEDHYAQLQKLLFGQGWKVQLSMLFYPGPPYADGVTDEDSVIQAMRAQYSAGQSPDAWHVRASLARKMREQGLTRDMADVLPTATPMLWQACKGAFSGAVDGIPMRLNTADQQGPIALLMSTEALTNYREPIANAEDILTYLEQTADTVIDDLWHEGMLLTDAWAAQQGYYSLSDYDYDLPGFLYARQDDPDCKIVPAEDIPGFEQFYLRFATLCGQRRLESNYIDSSVKLTGSLTRLSKGADHQVQVRMGLMGKDITALPLTGCNPVPELDAPDVYLMLAVNANSQKTDAVAAFAQWAMMDPKGYDLCYLGKQDTDYRMVDGRVEYLNAGVPFTSADWDYSSMRPVFYQFEYYFVSNPNLKKFTVYEAANADKVLADYKTVTPPIWKAKALLTDRDTMRSFREVLKPYEDVISQHDSDLRYSVSLVNSVPEFTPEQMLQRLKDNRRKLDPLLAAAQGELNKLLQK